MDEIPDLIWNSLFLKKGGFPDDHDCREDVARNIRDYRQAIKNGSLHKNTRVKIQQIIDAGKKLGRLLDDLKKNDEYKFAGMRGKENPIDVLVDVTKALVNLETQLKLDQVRFSVVTSESKNALPPLQILLMNMLAIQIVYSGKPPPTSPKETTTSLRFKGFLKSCVDFASDGQVHDSEIERTLDRITHTHNLLRVSDIDEWAAMWGLPPVSRGDNS
jgi:hypothetical protein